MAQIHLYPFPQSLPYPFTSNFFQKIQISVLSMYGRLYRATGRYNRAYTEISTGMTGLTAGHTGHSQHVFSLAEILAGLTGLMAGMTGHTLNCQKTVVFSI
jgi:hypothetical protein